VIQLPTLLEAVWLVIAAVGLWFSVVNLQAARGDLKAARLVHNFRRTTRLVIAEGALVRNRIRVGIFVWWLLLGIGFGFFELPEAPRIAGLLGLLATAAGLAFTGIQEVHERGEVAELLGDDQAEEAHDQQREAQVRR
jgi:hypothetical protein